jgi:hypothetical protein
MTMNATQIEIVRLDTNGRLCGEQVAQFATAIYEAVYNRHAPEKGALDSDHPLVAIEDWLIEGSWKAGEPVDIPALLAEWREGVDDEEESDAG